MLDRALMHVAEKASTFFEDVVVDYQNDYPVVFAKSAGDLVQMIREAHDIGFVEMSGNRVQLTIKGWDRIEKIKSGRIESDQTFVAMWFDPSLDAIWKDGFARALDSVGYNPVRIDEKQFNDKIDDQIISGIRCSGLVVADVTGHRQRVYFEGGFAMGLGVPVIWTCREDDIENAHFDTRQYNHIVWKDAEDLKTKLINRIEATIPARVRSPSR